MGDLLCWQAYNVFFFLSLVGAARYHFWRLVHQNISHGIVLDNEKGHMRLINWHYWRLISKHAYHAPKEEDWRELPRTASLISDHKPRLILIDNDHRSELANLPHQWEKQHVAVWSCRARMLSITLCQDDDGPRTGICTLSYTLSLAPTAPRL